VNHLFAETAKHAIFSGNAQTDIEVFYKGTCTPATGPNRRFIMVQNQYAPQYNPYAQQVPGFPPQQQGFPQGGFPGGGFPQGGQMPPDAYGPGMGAPTGPGQGVYQHESGGFADTNDLTDEGGGGILSKISNFAFSWKGLATAIVGGLGLYYGPSLWKSAFGKTEEVAKKAVTELPEDLTKAARENFNKFHGHAAPKTDKTAHKFMTELKDKKTKEEFEAYEKELDKAFEGLTGLQDNPQSAIDQFKQARKNVITAKIKTLDDKEGKKPTEDALNKLRTDLFAADKAYQDHVVTPLTPKSE
jgi:hypothetical protein